MIAKGQKINDRYQIIRSIGEGGMANVYLGYDTILDRNVAIKVLRGDLSTDEKFVRRFQREALSASSLSHPNVVEMYDVGEDDGVYYIVMEYIEGQTLKQLLKKRGNLTLSEAIDIMLQLTDGMAHAHDSYIIHRDLKPQNIMIQDDGQIKITDFGIAMALNSTQLTQTNSVMGSVHYLPPEQAAGKGSTIKSDIYSMGIIFYELLTGELPFRGDNAVEIALKQMKEAIPDLHEENPSIPMAVYNVILKSTAKNPKNRYNDAREMHDDLLTVLDDERINEEKYVYKYPEHDENPKTIKKLEEINEDTEVATKIDDENDKKGKKLVIILSIVAAVILIALISAVLIVPKVTAPKPVKIPNVKNMTVSKAESKLQSLGLEVEAKIEEVYDKDVKEGYIVKTDPATGRTVKQGTKVTLYKSLGVMKYTLEDYTGQVLTTVQSTLLENGIKIKVTKEDPTSETCKYIGKDAITWQSLASGSKVQSGDELELKTLNSVTFPKFKDMKLDEISEWANTNCVTLNIEYKDTYDKALVDTIMSQNRPAGATVKNNDQVTITVGRLAEEDEEKDNTTTDTNKDKDKDTTNKDKNN